MLSRLHVRNYVLIDSLEIDFPEGLIIITGQTGAGKSILLGALSLVMGAKADAAMVSEGADNCVVEAEFEMSSDDVEMKEFLEDNEVEWSDGHLIVRRTVNRSGRSRCFVNDSPVPVQVLQDISARLVDIHSQHQTLLLSDRQFQLGILDYFAGNTDLKEQCAALWKKLNALKAELTQLETRISRINSEKDYNEAQFRQLEAAALREGELEELEIEQKQLANAEEIKTGLCTVEELFTSASSGGEILSIDAALKESGRHLSRLARFIPAASDLSDRIDSCRRELDDILSEISDLNSRTDISETRLEEVENRMSLLYSLMQKHGCADVKELIGLRDKLSEALFDSTMLEEKRESLRKDIDNVKSELDAVADKLHESRAAAALPFAESIQESIRNLELPYSIFEVELLDMPVGANGRDSVQFRFSSSGRNAVDVAKCASGGEMSRIMLALKAMRARFAKMPTMIFDEIDTGVSGSVADKMGSMICSMGEFMQVFAITHLPQVAAKGKAHYLVSKDIDPTVSKAVSKIEKLSDDQRVLEVARMLSGSVLTDAAIANAKSLLQD
ncbi:MAG: DNA repair protein RecN [Bacteroidales bacterium]|nr:DNA repair protein RecN [Bacteroidales bacterium]